MAARQRPVLAFDIGGTKLAVAVVTVDGATHGLVVEPTVRDEGPDAVIKRMFEMGRRAVADARLTDPVGAVGFACGGPLDAKAGVLLCPPHLPGWIDIPLGELAAREFGVPFALENDATAGALAEYRFGAARGTATMVFLTISTGVGGGAVIDGRLHRGAAGNGGEFGHVAVRPGGRLCSCGRFGCVEAYASGTAIAQRAAEACEAGRPSVLSQLPTIAAEDVVRAAADGDELAVELWNETTDLLGIALTDIVNIIEPEIVVLGGGVTRAGAMLLDPVMTVVARDAMGPAASATRIERATLGDIVGVVGAGVVALDLVEAADA